MHYERHMHWASLVSFNDSDVTDVYLLYQNMTIKTSLCLTTQICMVKFAVRLRRSPKYWKMICLIIMKHFVFQKVQMNWVYETKAQKQRTKKDNHVLQSFIFSWHNILWPVDDNRKTHGSSSVYTPTLPHNRMNKKVIATQSISSFLKPPLEITSSSKINWVSSPLYMTDWIQRS